MPPLVSPPPLGMLIEPAPPLSEMERQLSSDVHGWDSGKVRQGNEVWKTGEKLSNRGELKPVNLNRSTKRGDGELFGQESATVKHGCGQLVPFMKALPL